MDPATPAPVAPQRVELLEHEDFQRLSHAASLKGLLRPFTGKGELEAWAGECEALHQELIRLAQHILAQGTAYPFSLLPVVLAQQSTGAGTALRWRNADRSAMGVSLWAKVMAQPATPPALIPELFALERQRITINMQISLLHTLARQARECVGKMAHAEAVYQQRVTPTTLKESRE